MQYWLNIECTKLSTDRNKRGWKRAKSGNQNWKLILKILRLVQFGVNVTHYWPTSDMCGNKPGRAVRCTEDGISRRVNSNITWRYYIKSFQHTENLLSLTHYRMKRKFERKYSKKSNINTSVWNVNNPHNRVSFFFSIIYYWLEIFT